MSRVAVIVDDLPFYRHRIRNTLRHLGYLVYEANDGEEGIRITRRVNPDVVLLDQVMPGLSGRDTFERILADGYTGPVIVLSPRPESGEAQALLGLGVRALLPKAASSDVIEAELRRQLEVAPAA